jgi:hypothetical protein
MFGISYIFKPNTERYEGVRPINIYLLRVLYFLMLVFIGSESWTTLISHQGPWDHVHAVAWCVWAAYTTLSLFGLINPLRWLPLVIFMIFYKSLWLLFVAYPLWSAGTLAGSPADEMAHVFIGAPFVALIVPWKYVFEKYIRPQRSPI